jgi:hypothetical protein
MRGLISVGMLAVLAGVAKAGSLPAPPDGQRPEMFQASGRPAVVGVLSWPAGRVRATPQPRPFEVSAIRVANWLARVLGMEGEGPVVDNRVFGRAPWTTEHGAGR